MNTTEARHWLALDAALREAEQVLARVYLAAATVGVRRKELRRLKQARTCVLDVASAVADDVTLARAAME